LKNSDDYKWNVPLSKQIKFTTMQNVEQWFSK